MVYRSQEDISSFMRKVKGQDTTPEIVIRKALWKQGLRYRTNVTSLPGKPDIVFPRQKVVVFVDGDFWHGNQWRRRKHRSLEEQFTSIANKDYWLTKIGKNVERDRHRTEELVKAGWRVIRLWESDIMRDLQGSVSMITSALSRTGEVASASVPQKTVAEYFAGIGLMRLGLEQEGWKVVFANDIDADKFKMYSDQFDDASSHFVLNDIHKIAGDSVPSSTIATASFPCNDLSLAGARDGLQGKHSSAYWGFIRILNEMGDRRPPIVLLENVAGFLTSHDGKDFREALLALNGLGYTVDAFIMDAVNFVPQSRTRLFVIGSLKPETRTEAINETPGFYESSVRPKALADFIFTHPEINWSIRPLPTPPQRAISLVDILENLSVTSPEWWSSDRTKYLLNQMSQKHLAQVQKMSNGADWSYGTVFRRVRKGKSMAELRIDGVAGCLRTPRGGSGRQILVQAGKGEIHARLLTPRECARLMGADSFTIEVPLNQALFGFGDAVCVPVIAWIARYYLNPLVTELLHDLPIDTSTGEINAYGKQSVSCLS
ncbi:MAG: DNA mismatch endonuclease Vsr [Armatimonadota bacterium]